MRSNIGIGSRNLATYIYTDDRYYYPEKLDYGNGDYVQYTYDSQGRVTSQTYENGDTVSYQLALTPVFIIICIQSFTTE